MFIEASSPRRPNEIARFISQLFKPVPARGKCLQFWYHMFGADIGTLNVIQKTGPGNKSESLLWTLSGQQGTKWLNGRVSLNKNPSKNFWIVFEGVRGKGYQGDIAIDDILITNAGCSILPASANPITPTATTHVVTTKFTLPPTIPPSLYNCDFGKSFCNYTQEQITDVFNWTRHQGGTYSGGTGPTIDHTKQQGVVVSPNGPGSLQQLLSGKCVHVYLGGHTKPSPGHSVVFYDGCGEARLEFQLTSDGYMKYTKYNMCWSRRGGPGSNADDVVLVDSCTDKWKFTSARSIQHISTSKCVIANKGTAGNNVKLVLSSSCDQKNQIFRWQPSELDIIFRYLSVSDHVICLYVEACWFDGQHFELLTSRSAVGVIVSVIVFIFTADWINQTGLQWRRGGNWGGGTQVGFGWVCATQASQFQPRFGKGLQLR